MNRCLFIPIEKCMLIVAVIIFSACGKEGKYEDLGKSCIEELSANITLTELKLLYAGETIQIQQDLIIEGYVISSDKAGNFFGSLHFQDSPVFPTEGLQIEIDLMDTHLFFNEGTKILIKLKGLYFGKSKLIYKIGGVFEAFGTETVGRLPANLVQQHIFLSCEDVPEIRPSAVTIKDLDDRMLNSLVKLEELELIEEEQHQVYANEEQETERILTDCTGNTILLLNSGYSDFHNELMPSGNGSIIGVLHKANRDYQLIIRDTSDINFTRARCKSATNEVSTDKVFISELADPDNNNKARFVELYNAEVTDIGLDGWLIKRYTNDNTEVGSVIDLTGYTILAENTLVISPDSTEFERVYGINPDVGVGVNSPADSNGDDNLELVDPFGRVVDIFGIIGEDGSGTNHEFEDGKAIRKLEIANGNPEFNANEWIIFNDTGAEGTINMPQIAPEDFDPGNR